ncbi:sel1 repeat family protein [Novosphingobium aerophilum]|uniref:Sel1 repeat family protein n=1 Tax=Novosphingobium aerophilum TaxID=2839843 RepID=A0A7X1KE00_9SPHN|nr:sel1 repeat family protein [Novosphingobium aerophilum]MBC2653677.1 sel1 repeat family protein [Novosphingobium aerophilum]
MIRADQLGFQRVALRVAAGLALGASALAGGCAAPTSYMGLNLTAPDLPAELRDLARRAQAGDKQAQLDLGIAFEEGHGVARNLRRAARLYAQAGSDSGGKSTFFVPTSPGGAVSTISASSGPHSPGLLAAKQRLGQIEFKARQLDSALVTVVGSPHYLGISNICNDEPAIIAQVAPYSVSDCRAVIYNIEIKKGLYIDVVDLTLITEDQDAIQNVPIPFGLMDPSESELYTESDKHARFEVKFRTFSGAFRKYNVLIYASRR